ncbi:hypothetical protein ABIE11_003372 [Lelliottia sp. 489]
MKSGKRIFLLLLLAVAGCHSARPITPEETGEMPYGLWGFVFFTPKALPAFVNYVGIIDDKKVLYSFRTLDRVEDDASSIGLWNNRYMNFAQFNKARHPPVAMLFCWDSIIDKKTYETRIIFPASMREKMNTSTGWVRRPGTVQFCLVWLPRGRLESGCKTAAGETTCR